MRAQAHAVAVSWVPAESVVALLRLGFDSLLARAGGPPVDRITDPGDAQLLRGEDGFRGANVLTAWTDDGEAGFGPDSGLIAGATAVRVAAVDATFGAYVLPTLQDVTVHPDGTSVLTQTAGGRSAVPLPRRLGHDPVVLWHAPIVWTTVRLTLHPDGRAEAAVSEASPFPRHWLYGPDGTLAAASQPPQPGTWVTDAFTCPTPWGAQGSESLTGAVRDAVVRNLVGGILRPGHGPEIREIAEGTVLTEQGAGVREILTVLDGVLAANVDGATVAHVGAGAVFGERAVLGGGSHGATLTAVTPALIAAAPQAAIDVEKLHAIAELRRSLRLTE